MEITHNSHNSIFHEDKGDVLNQLLHACVDEICGYPGPTFEKFRNMVDWSENDFHNIYKLLSNFLRNPTALYVNEEKMPLEYYEFPEFARKNILKCLKVRQEQLTDALFREFAKRNLPTLNDFDWRLKYVMGSSKMASIREPLLQLDLILSDAQEEKNVTLEMNRSELDMLISSLETIVR